MPAKAKREAGVSDNPSRGLLRILDYAEDVVMATFLATAAVLGLLQVVLRYGFATGFDWVEQTLIILVVDSALVGAAVAVRRGTHVRLDMLAEALAPRPRQILLLVTNILGFGFAAVLAYAGAKYVEQIVRFDMMNIESGFPDWVHYVGVPIAMGLVALRFLQEIWRLATEPPGSDASHGEASRS